jgi:nucleoside-diphosphate-sugar epimerase
MSQDESVLITGAAGFIGQYLAAALLESSPKITLTLTDVTEPPVPASVSQYADRVTASSSDLTDPSAVAALLSAPFKAVYLLHGLMSGGAEANLELGWRVNWDSHRSILDHLRTHHRGTVVIFPSSLAVYGPTAAGEVTSESTNPLPQSSYGAQKLMVETYLNDFSRRGLLDGRIVRLPTVVVRPGAPSAAASSFASGIIREPLRGQKSILPVARDLEMWVCSPRTVVTNLIRIKNVPGDKFGLSRVTNLPGITVTVQQMLDALEKVGGSQALGLVEEERDAKIEAIVGSWPARFDTSRARGLRLEADQTLLATVNEFAESLGK